MRGGPWLALVEAFLVKKLLESQAFHRAIGKAHKSVHRLRHGIPPEEMGGTKLDNPNTPGFLSHFLDEVKGQAFPKSGNAVKKTQSAPSPQPRQQQQQQYSSQAQKPPMSHQSCKTCSRISMKMFELTCSQPKTKALPLTSWTSYVISSAAATRVDERPIIFRSKKDSRTSAVIRDATSKRVPPDFELYPTSAINYTRPGNEAPRSCQL